jgi:hypothetical protein
MVIVVWQLISQTQVGVHVCFSSKYVQNLIESSLFFFFRGFGFCNMFGTHERKIIALMKGPDRASSSCMHIGYYLLVDLERGSLRSRNAGDP